MRFLFPVFIALVFSLSRVWASIGTVYILPELNLEEKILELSILPNLGSPLALTIISIQEQDDKSQLLLPLNLKVFPHKPMSLKYKISDKLLDPSQTLSRLKFLTKDDGVKIAPLILKRTKLQNMLMPHGWKQQVGRLTIPKGNYTINGILNLSENQEVIFELGVNLFMGPNASLILNGSVKANQMSITSAKSGENWGSFILYGYGKTSIWKNVTVIGGQDSLIDQQPHSCSFCLYGGKHEVDGLTLQNSQAEDGLNAKEAQVVMANSTFMNSMSDAFDCDICQLEIKKVKFDNTGGDALDVSGNNLIASELLITKSSDKGISIGENSQATVSHSSFTENSIGIAVKDSSRAVISENNFKQNQSNVSLYRKKIIWGGGRARLVRNHWDERRINCDSESSYSEN